MSTMNNTMNTTENRNYIAEFYKNPEHNYEDFFGAYVADEKIEKVNKEIKTLFEQIDSKKEELSRLNALRYNEMFTPTDKKLLLHYEPDRGNTVEAYFDIVTGFAVNVNDYDGDEVGITSVGRKAGDFQVVSGYCLPLGAIVLRYYNYKIATNNARCSFCLTKETIVPILDYDSPSFDNNGNWNLPRIKAIGAAKWAEICNQLLGLCKTATSFNVKGTIDIFLKISFCRNDTGERCRMWLSYSSAGKNKGYFLNYSVEGSIADTYYLNPSEEYYSPYLGEDKDSWLVKWDDYNIYNLFRSALMKEIERRIKVNETRIRSVKENYDEIAGK